ncbi:glycosyltransferase family 4 protein [bacterium]|nr:glycosyltransferase family 4 protein [bacterium]
MKIPKLQKSSKKRILLLSDDLRLHSGIGTMSREFVKGTVDTFDWIQIGGAVNHPEAGKYADISKHIADETGVTDACVKVFATSGYGDQNLIREIIQAESIDGILHFTDPRFWGWLYAMENELRLNIPLMYYNIWDDLPFPHWNENAYESCDLLMAISKQTYNINKHVCQRKPRVEGVDLTYVPHGINEKQFYPVDKSTDEYIEFKKHLFNDKEFDFVALFNSRNIQRKRPSDLVLAYKKLCDSLPKVESNKCALILHTDVTDQHGTDLAAVAKALCPDYPVIFSNQKLPAAQLNLLYNVADVVCNPSSAEGFGLTHMEAMMTGTPTIATVVGGLQDQMGFVTEEGEPFNVHHLSAETPSNSTGEVSKDWGKWTYPLWPQLNLQGSPATPYIYDSRVNIGDIAQGLKWWYNMSAEHREKCGLEGREWAIDNGFTAAAMCSEMVKSINMCMNTFKKADPYTFTTTNTEQIKYPDGVLI